MKTFTYTPIATSTLTATDLQQEAKNDSSAQAFRITIYENEIPMVETAEALYVDGRMGIAWGADATWADVNNIEGGIEMWLNDGDAWRAAN
jgi:hypothetical protein